MERSVLADNGTAVDADDITTWECLPNKPKGFSV